MNSALKTNPVQLQANLFQAAMLWKQFCLKAFSEQAGKQNAIPKPSAFHNAVAMWGMNLMSNPASVWQANMDLMNDQMQLWQNASAKMLGMPDVQISDESLRDKRFRAPIWKEHPANETTMQAYLNFSKYWANLASIQEGMPEHEAKQAEFFLNNIIDALSPNNYANTNPEVWQAILDTNGENLVKGMENLLQDYQNGELRIRMTDQQAFTLGEDIATTPGKVVFRNEMFELLQYTPSTDKVRQRPLLIVPPWINKFYILDLREKNSYIRWAVEQGHTVFVMSWVNPDASMKDVSFEDYVLNGTIAAMDAIEQATGERKINMAAYCIGGTLTATTLAYLAAKKDKRVQSATFFTTLLDFCDVGEISVFIDEAQVQSIENVMDENGGFLDGKNMGAVFNMLRANDLIWSFFINLYLLGKDPMAFDLLYWNSDSTRMPAAMHSFYLRNMYLNNKLREPNGISVGGEGIDLSKVDTPVYFISTVDDHIAPWKTTYEGTKLFSGPVRFVLGESGHIAGIINPASVDKYGHWTNNSLADTPDAWLEGAKKSTQSWWHDWDKWVSQYAGKQVDARKEGGDKLEVLGDAPGTYVVK